MDLEGLPESENIEDRRGADPSMETGRRLRFLIALMQQVNAADARNMNFPGRGFNTPPRMPPGTPPDVIPPEMGQPMQLSNPMMPFQLPTDQAFAMQQLISLLGGLGNAPTAAGAIAPTLTKPKQVQPKDNSLDPILGGLSMTGQTNPMKGTPYG